MPAFQLAAFPNHLRNSLGFYPGPPFPSVCLVLHYLDDFLAVGYGSGNVRCAAGQLCSALRLEGAIISPKSILKPVPEIDWLGKRLVLSGELAGFLQWRGGCKSRLACGCALPSFPCLVSMHAGW